MKYRSLALVSALVPGAGLTACSSSGDPAPDVIEAGDAWLEGLAEPGSYDGRQYGIP